MGDDARTTIILTSWIAAVSQASSSIWTAKRLALPRLSALRLLGIPVLTNGPPQRRFVQNDTPSPLDDRSHRIAAIDLAAVLAGVIVRQLVNPGIERNGVRPRAGSRDDAARLVGARAKRDEFVGVLAQRVKGAQGFQCAGRKYYRWGG